MSLLSLDIKFKVCWYQVLLCVNIINLLFWRPLILGRVPVYCAPPVLSCPVPVQLYLDLPHYSPGYSPLTTRYSVQFADCKHIFILPIIEHFHNPWNQHDFQILSYKIKIKIRPQWILFWYRSGGVWNNLKFRKMIYISWAHF